MQSLKNGEVFPRERGELSLYLKRDNHLKIKVDLKKATSIHLRREQIPPIRLPRGHFHNSVAFTRS